MAAQEHEAWKSEVLSRVEPEIFEMLRAVRARGLKVGIISNALPEEVLAWQFCPLQDLVDPVVFSCSVGVMKPDREIFGGFWLNNDEKKSRIPSESRLSLFNCRNDSKFDKKCQ